MKREEFIAALRARLNRLPAEELEDALDYYNEIFLDAGEENDEATAESLGSIDDIARQIYVENGIEPDGRPVFMVDEFTEEKRNQSHEVYRQEPTVSGSTVNSGKLLLLVVLFPLWLPLLIVCFTLTFVFFILGFVLEIVFVAVGGATVISGIVTLFSIPPVGLIELGTGLMLVGLFVLTFKYVFAGSWKAFTGAINKFVGTMHNIFVGGEAHA